MLRGEFDFIGTRFDSADERGSFSKLFGKSPLGRIQFNGPISQVNYVKNKVAGTLRGLHYQIDEYSESKVIHCIKGSVWDVAVDVRPESPTYKQWTGNTLSASNMNFMRIPRGFAHGYITLEDETELIYFSDNELSMEHEKGVIWDDVSIGIKWPIEPVLISGKDQSWPTLMQSQV
jgi:dTDP-4-dehydrorhamnose 3,5-epimerase